MFVGMILAGIAIAIFLVVALIAIAIPGLGCTVVYNTQDLGLDKLELMYGSQECIAITIILSNNKKDTVYLIGNSQCIADLTNRRQI